MKYWLFKSEPDCFSIDDLERERTEPWDGTRNYQVRNMMRDEISVGDQVLFYHSNAKKETGIAGIAQVVKGGYPDHTAEDPHSDHPDPKHTSEKPIWYMVDVQFVRKFDMVLRLTDIKIYEELSDMQLLRKGNRLSVFEVDKEHFDFIVELGNN